MVIVSALILNCCVFGALLRPLAPMTVVTPLPPSALNEPTDEEIQKLKMKVVAIFFFATVI